ncbi:MAG: sulfatase-like hydrolase/transferase [Planctomycetaceae bacterium]|jgi:arylsulfatase A-like enzyme|nr:sulfatase-like hydrolase/transferase [Planctomycetaceae bacterium]
MRLRCHVVLSFLVLGFVSSLQAADRPNFLWILSEDNSKHFLKLFDEHGAETPNIAKLAEQGLIFNHAFSNSPVCSVARTTLITSVYAPRLGTQYHRKIYTVPMPEGWKMFPAYLNDAGYYTSNNSKKDYNAEETANTWNDSSKKSSWRKRPDKSQPFFHMQTFGDSHESSLHFSQKQMETQKTDTDPDSVFIAPVHPETPTFRYTYARYHDRIQVIDQKVGQLVKQLKDDGLLEETFIFYFGDHGGVLPGSKGYANERGLHVPLVVRVPEKFQHLVDTKTNTRVDGFVSFIDFGPTLIKLAGLDVPEHMDGKPFLGEGVSMIEVNARDEAFGHADRFDEKYDMVRTLRKGDLKYHRNYQSYYPDGLQNNYRYKMLAYQEWRELYHAGKLNAVQAAFFEPKAPEALYDLANDPYETKNLAGDPAYAEKLVTMREKVGDKVRSMPDLSIFPEPIMIKLMKQYRIDAFRKFTVDGKGFLVDLINQGDLALLPFAEAEPKLKEALKDSEPGVVYWALTACCSFGKQAASLEKAIRGQLDSSDEMVRLQAAVFLSIIKAEEPQPHLMGILKEAEDPTINVKVLNDVVYLQDALGYEFNITPKDVTAQNGEVKRRLEYLEE